MFRRRSTSLRLQAYLCVVHTLQQQAADCFWYAISYCCLGSLSRTSCHRYFQTNAPSWTRWGRYLFPGATYTQFELLALVLGDLTIRIQHHWSIKMFGQYVIDLTCHFLGCDCIAMLCREIRLVRVDYKFIPKNYFYQFMWDSIISVNYCFENWENISSTKSSQTYGFSNGYGHSTLWHTWSS